MSIFASLTNRIFLGSALLAGEQMLSRKVYQVCRMGVGRTFQVVRSFPRLPLLKRSLAAISAIYLLRAVGYIPALFVAGAPVGTFAWVSSAIVLLYAVVHVIGTLQLWRS